MSSNGDRDEHAAEEVIAATAGRDTWQTWAGRKSGTEDFEYMDIFRGIKRSVNNSLRSNIPTKGTSCPVCFCEPDANESPSSFWHVTWCGHAICKDCLGQYASSQVRDREQTGPLKCPVCLKILRKQDAVVAMMAGKHNASNVDLIKQWDVKMRNRLLQALPSFRSCPKCGGGGNSDENGDVQRNNIGGGFVTPECLGPQHQERRDQAVDILLTRNYAYAAIAGVYFLVVGTITWTKSSSALLDLWSMLLPIYVFAKTGMAVNFLLARRAREALFRSISVECPCCDESFVLPTESKQLEDEETSRWVTTNTRPCPSCSVPISKAGGCNHVRCSHCGANFCWACMRLRTACQAYRCRNGAPYRDATLLDDFREEQPVRRLQALQRDGSVLTYIDYILNHRVCPELRYRDGFLVLACLVARHLPIVQNLERGILSPLLRYLYQRTDLIVSLFSFMNLVTLAMPAGWWNASIGRIFPRLAMRPGGRERRFGLDRQRQEEISQNMIFIFFISLFSLPIGLSMGVGYFVNEIVPLLQHQGQQEAPARQQQGERGRQRRQNVANPENPNPQMIEVLNQNMLNEAIRRSIEDT
mmetsp:Transcript_6280/g.12991  ORF Transcript_6280/g.12991 Transcript_6280/m.12991 type:complete len:586 (-) Transcript_6280:74-1831(-)